MTAWEPSDVSITDPEEHRRRSARIRELSCWADGEIYEIQYSNDYMDYSHACPAHLPNLIGEDPCTVHLAQAATKPTRQPIAGDRARVTLEGVLQATILGTRYLVLENGQGKVLVTVGALDEAKSIGVVNDSTG